MLVPHHIRCQYFSKSWMMKAIKIHDHRWYGQVLCLSSFHQEKPHKSTSPHQPTVFFHPPQSEWRQIQPLYTKRWTPARYVFFWPLDVSFLVSDSFHHITSPISRSSSSKEIPPFLGHGFREPVGFIVSGKHHFSWRIKPGRCEKTQKSP